MVLAEHAKLEQEAKTLLEQQQFSLALPVLEQWLSLQPENAEAHYLIAGAYGNTGQFKPAEAHCRQALKLQPVYLEALFRLANALDGQGKAKEALEYFKKTIEINPNIAHVWNNMGACYMSQKEYAAAERAYRMAIELESNIIQFYYNLALALIPQNSITGKLQQTREILSVAEQMAEKQGGLDLADQLYFDTMLGISFMTFHIPASAEIYFRKNLALEPDNAESHLNLALALVAQNKEQEALKSARRAQQSWVDDQPTNLLAEIFWSMSLIYLGLGDYKKAWPLYEYRWKRDNKTPRDLPKSLWQGESLKGKTIYLFHEQGFGDNLQFARYFKILKQQGATIIYECQKPLQRLFSTFNDIDQLITSEQEPQEYDYYLPLASLPGILKTTLENIPFGAGDAQESGHVYLTVPQDDYSAIDALLKNNKTGAAASQRIGIFWRGSGSQANDKRPCDLSNWLPLLEKKNLAFYSLQKELSEQDEQLLKQYNVMDMRSAIKDFADTAYIISQLDLVVSIDTSVAHLAGALGSKAKILLAHASDWRWGRDTESTPWYPTLQLYRQAEIGDWGSVINQLAADIS